MPRRRHLMTHARMPRVAVLVPAPIAPSSFDPATLTLTGWWRASYGGSPWTPTASAGGSGAAGNLAQVTTPPGVGAAVNGLTPADFDGTNDFLANAGTAFVGAAAGTCIAVVWIDTYGADGAGYDEEQIFCDNGGFFGLSVGSAGVHGWIYPDNAGYASKAATTGAWHIVCMRWGAGVTGLLVDSAAEATVVSGSATTGGSLRVGSNYANLSFFDGKILDIMFMATRISDANYANVKTYANARYGLSL